MSITVAFLDDGSHESCRLKCCPAERWTAVFSGIGAPHRPEVLSIAVVLKRQALAPSHHAKTTQCHLSESFYAGVVWQILRQNTSDKQECGKGANAQETRKSSSANVAIHIRIHTPIRVGKRRIVVQKKNQARRNRVKHQAKTGCLAKKKRQQRAYLKGQWSVLTNVVKLWPLIILFRVWAAISHSNEVVRWLEHRNG